MKLLPLISTVSLSMLSQLTFAAITAVAPGEDTLQTAIIAAADGDTLVLENGTYSNSSTTINIDTKSLTIKAESAAATPTIIGTFIATGSINYLRLQGITLIVGGYVNNTAITVSAVNNLEILDSTIYGALSFSPGTSGSKFTMIGSHYPCPTSFSNGNISLNVQEANIMGNDLCFDDGRLYLQTTATGTIYNIIGNNVTAYTTSSDSFVYASSGSDDIIKINSNRFTQKFNELGKTTNTLSNTSHYSLMGLSSSAAAEIRNNIFKLEPANIPADNSTAFKFNITDYLQNKTFENNIFDFGNLSIVSPDPEDTNQLPIINNIPKSFRGNIIVNYNDRVVSDTFKTYLSNNLCFNNEVDCGTADGNLNADPIFTDTANNDYTLQSGSPAINNGPADLELYDTDGTRNDMGPYSGSWSIEQFDAQREPGATGPYIFPVIDASKTVASGEVKVRFVTYPRFK